MVKKAYQIRKDGDFYVIPAGYLHGVFHKELKTMDRTRAEDAIKARKTLSLKRKYPEVRKGVNESRQKPKSQTILDENSRIIPKVKLLPDIFIDHEFTMRLKGINNPQVTQANAAHYLADGYKVDTFGVEGKFALYVSDQKIKWRR